MELASFLQSHRVASPEIARRTREIYSRLLQESAHVRQGNFEVIHPDDLKRLFEEYDREFFERRLQQTLGNTPMHFRLSRRLTSAAGTLTSRKVKFPDSSKRQEYELTISVTLMFQTFSDVSRQITVSGLPCHDRLEALQRVFEHELVHLCEFLAWSDSSCRQKRFQSITNRFFGHTEHTHRLITPRERALSIFGVKVGDRVFFRVDNELHHGIVNRITRRATVLVEDARGRRYSDGKYYRKFYVPVNQLKPLSAAGRK